MSGVANSFGLSPVRYAIRITCPCSVDSACTVGLAPLPPPNFCLVTLLFDYTTQGGARTSGPSCDIVPPYADSILDTGHGCLISSFPMWVQTWIATLLTSGTNTGPEKTSHYRGAHRAHPIETHQLGNTEQGAGDCAAPQ